MQPEKLIRGIKLDIGIGVLGVSFVMRHDRFGHTLWLQQDDIVTTVLESIESLAEDFWPSSPAFQHVEQHSPTSIVCIGMAGSNHWSASIDVSPERSIRFDVACRIRRKPGFLGSTYAFNHPAAIDCRTASFALGGKDAKMVVRASESHGAGITAADREFVLHPIDIAALFPATVRWKYDIHVDCS